MPEPEDDRSAPDLHAPSGRPAPLSAPPQVPIGRIPVEDLKPCVDTARIADTLRASLGRRSQVDLATHLSEHPPTLGLAEIIAHLAVTEEDIEIVTDESVQVDIPYEDVEGMPRSVRLAQVTYCRPTTTIRVAGATGRRVGSAERRTGSAGGQTLTTEGPP